MPPEPGGAVPLQGITFEVGEVKGGLTAMNERMGRMERSLDRGLAEIKIELRTASDALSAATRPLDARIAALERRDSERRGERGAWLGVSSLIGGAIVAASEWVAEHLTK